jgi:HlyD family secretion protein
MTRTKKILIGGGGAVVLGVMAYVNLGYDRNASTPVTIEKVTRHDLEAIVTASGKVQPKRQVNISAETVGKVVNLAVAEGDTVKRGQLLMQIDPRNLETAVQNRAASLASARSQLDQTRAQVENAKVTLKQAQDNFRRQENLFKEGLLARTEYERAQNDLKMRETDLLVSQQAVQTQEQRIKQEEANLESATYDLNKVRIVSPMDGLVTRRNIEEGETVVTGTMNNAGTVLLTIADMSVIDTEIEVDETDIPYVSIGQSAKVTIDAIPDQTFTGHVTEVGNSPIQAAGSNNQAAGGATNFKVVVTLDGTVPNVRPGFTCTAVITTATRKNVLGVPIQALAVRELVVDAKGTIVPAPPTPPSASTASRAAQPVELKPGQSRKEFEGVFLARGGRAAFVPVKTGIAGEKYFEVLDGLKENDEVITGPFASVRLLKEGDPVKTQAAVAGVPPAGTR